MTVPDNCIGALGRIVFPAVSTPAPPAFAAYRKLPNLISDRWFHNPKACSEIGVPLSTVTKSSSHELCTGVPVVRSRRLRCTDSSRATAHPEIIPPSPGKRGATGPDNALLVDVPLARAKSPCKNVSLQVDAKCPRGFMTGLMACCSADPASRGQHHEKARACRPRRAGSALPCFSSTSATITRDKSRAVS
jgi:hypothetical protein